MMIAQSKKDFTKGIVFVIKAQVVFQIELGSREGVVTIRELSLYLMSPSNAGNQ